MEPEVPLLGFARRMTGSARTTSSRTPAATATGADASSPLGVVGRRPEPERQRHARLQPADARATPLALERFRNAAQAIPDGVIDICPANASLQVRFDPDTIAPDRLDGLLRAEDVAEAVRRARKAQAALS